MIASMIKEVTEPHCQLKSKQYSINEIQFIVSIQTTLERATVIRSHEKVT